MRSMNERPVCHRAEDLVTYLYGEATADEAQDFAMHLQHCDACGAEVAMFNQVHDSIVSWRNEALGSSFAPAASPVVQPVSVSAPLGQREGKLSAWAALREFFTVSPLWLRGAMAKAGLNIHNMLNKSRGEMAYTMVDVDSPVAQSVIDAIAAINGVLSVRSIPAEQEAAEAARSEVPVR